MKTVVPILYLFPNQRGRVVSILGGWRVTSRLLSLGFTPGTRVKVLYSSYPGPILVSIRGCKIVLGRGEAMKILVEVIRRN